MIKLDSLSTDWSLIDGEGLVRVIPIDNYRSGFVVLANIGVLADKFQYYPEVTLARDKLTIVIADDNEKLATNLARGIDEALVAPLIQPEISEGAAS